MRRLLALLSLSVACYGQQNLKMFLTANAVSSGAATVSVYAPSLVGLQGSYIYIDSEAMQVVQAVAAPVSSGSNTGFPSVAILTVTRSILSTTAASHTVGTTVWAGSPAQFVSTDPSGFCLSTQGEVLNVITQKWWACSQTSSLSPGAWVSFTTVNQSGGGGGGSGTVYLNVKTFGATGNGVSDDAPAVQSTIAAACSAGGGKVIFPPGTYKLTSFHGPAFLPNVHIWVNCSNVTIQGFPGSIVTEGATTNGTSILFSYGTAGSPTNAGVNVRTWETNTSYAMNVAIEGANTVTTTTASDAGHFTAGQFIYIKGAAIGQPGEFDDELNIVESANASTGVITLANNLSVNYPTSPTVANADFTIQNTAFQSIEMDYDADPIIGFQSYVSTIDKCVLKHIGTTGNSEAIPTDHMFNGYITNNLLIDLQQGSRIGVGIDIERSSGTVYVSNNVLNGTYSSIGAGEASKRIFIVGNTINSATGSPALALGGARHVAIDNNAVMMSSSVGSNFAIDDSFGAAYGYDISITNNKVTAVGAGGSCIAAQEPGTVIANNSLTCSAVGIESAEGTEVISSNHITMTGTAAPGILIISPVHTQSVTGNSINGNSGSGTTGLQIQDNGAQVSGITAIGNIFTNLVLGINVVSSSHDINTKLFSNTFLNNTTNQNYNGQPLPVVVGGTGTATPSLVAGSNVTITGTWPNQTVASSGGGGGSPGGISGDIQFNNAGAFGGETLVPVAHGGTGTATPAIVPGANVTVSGSWPAQTVSATSCLGTVTGSGLTSTAIVTGAGGTSIQTPSATATLDATGNLTLPAASTMTINGSAVVSSGHSLISNSTIALLSNAMFFPSSIPFATLTGLAPSNGAVAFCSDCTNVAGSHTAGDFCAGSGSGALAVRQSGVWKCF